MKIRPRQFEHEYKLLVVQLEKAGLAVATPALPTGNQFGSVTSNARPEFDTLERIGDLAGLTEVRFMIDVSDCITDE